MKLPTEAFNCSIGATLEVKRRFKPNGRQHAANVYRPRGPEIDTTCANSRHTLSSTGGTEPLSEPLNEPQNISPNASRSASTATRYDDELNYQKHRQTDLVYSKGREILRASSGGLITKLLQNVGVETALDVLEAAAESGDDARYVVGKAALGYT